MWVASFMLETWLLTIDSSITLESARSEAGCAGDGNSYMRV